MPPTTMTVDGFPIPVDVSGPETGPVVVLLGAAQQATAAYEGVCQRLHNASLRTVVIGLDPRLRSDSVLGILDWLEVPWAVLVGDRAGADLAWDLAARRLDRFTALVVVDRGHPRAADADGQVRDADCPPVEINTTALVSTAATRAVAVASQQFVFGDFRVVDLLGRRNAAESTAQLASEIVLRTSTW
ncbi:MULTISPECIES: alpha/beta fold hydrolase [Mycolicibacterium]|uniref:Membrane protein n=1 Tax=Mycolicibacterium chitae TaxID=1792 RepID=A0A3S4SAD4_MYCCI|nr:alpha/beta hydrolase [Mycolicibacterium chitae]MCV7105947.1 alpha/beta hydrolase [Mycolicibacterium chitae]VEG48679.1 membrane protein [Mycolicibacterium chitae]